MEDFFKFNLPRQLLQSLERMNISVPTPVQSASLPIALSGSDLLASAQTGTGKTLAFSLPLVTHILSNSKASALILTPTRELATQVLSTIKELLNGCIPCPIALLIGGDSMPAQLAQLRKRPRIIVGTPGRINDHLLRGNLNLHQTNFLVIDEADRMLDMGFSIQLDKIAHYLPKARQTLMFSATMPANIIKLSQSYLQNPQSVTINSTNKPAANITQEIIHINANDKFNILLTELTKRDGSIIVFVKTKRNAEQLANQLNQENHNADAIHGDLRQRQRDRIIINFRSLKTRILVATDIAARGLDVPEVKHVINFHLPQCPEDYIHRIGRTARAGSEGNALCLIAPDERSKWKMIHRLMYPGKPMAEMPSEQNISRSEAPQPQCSYLAANNDSKRVGKPGGHRFRHPLDEKAPRGSGRYASRFRTSDQSDSPRTSNRTRSEDGAKPDRTSKSKTSDRPAYAQNRTRSEDGARPDDRASKFRADRPVNASKPARPGANGKPDYAKKNSSRPSFAKSGAKPMRPFSRSSSRPSTRAS